MKTKELEAVLLTCDKPYLSGRFYPKEIVEKAVEKFNKDFGTLFVEAPGNDTETVDMTKIFGMINDMHLDGKEVKGTVTLLDTPEANKIKDLDLNINLVGHGQVDFQTNFVTEYKIDKVVVYPNKEDKNNGSN